MEEKDTKKNTTQGKGKNKNKKQTINLNDFVSAGTTQAGFTAVPAMRWSDVMDDEDEDTSNYGGKNQDSVVILPTAPKSIRGPDIDINTVPTQPPFICYLSNLPFEASEDDITKFFKDLKITRINLSRDPGATGRMRGQGSCEFPDRQTLINAFNFNSETIKNRPIKLSLNSFETERENYRREREGEREDRTAGDWRSGKPDRPAGSSNFQQTNRSSYSDSNYFGNNRNRNYENRNNYGGNDSFGDNTNNNNNRNSYNNYNNRQSNRMEHNSYSNKYNYSDHSSNKYPASVDLQSQRNDEPPKERTKLVLEKRTLPVNIQPPLPQQHQDNQRSINTPPQRTSESETKSIEPEKPVERKKLILKPKTKKDDESSSEAPKVNPSIFGEAKPVDTTKRLLEIEIKKQQELQEQEKLLEDKKLEKEVIEKFEKPARDFNNQRTSNREYNKQRSSDSGSQQGDTNRSHYRENKNDFSHDNSNRNNRYNDGNGYRKQQGGVRRINQTGNRNYNNDNYQSNNRDFNRENNNRDNYNSRDNQRDHNQRVNKFSNNNNRNNSWNNDHMDNSKRHHEQNYDERPNNRQNANRRDRGNDGFNQSMNKFHLLNEEMD